MFGPWGGFYSGPGIARFAGPSPSEFEDAQRLSRGVSFSARSPKGGSRFASVNFHGFRGRAAAMIGRIVISGSTRQPFQQGRNRSRLAREFFLSSARDGHSATCLPQQDAGIHLLQKPTVEHLLASVRGVYVVR